MTRWGWRRGALIAVTLAVLAPAGAAQAVADITLTFTVSSVSGADSRSVTVHGPGDSYFFDETDGNTLTVTGPPGPYNVVFEEYGGPQGDWSFYGQTIGATYSGNTTVPVTVPLHTLALELKDGAGAPAQADVTFDCYDANPAGWSYAETSAYRTVNGNSSLLVANHSVGDEPCDLTVDPVVGAYGTAQVPGNAASFTYTVPDAITVTYNLSSTSGATSRDVYVSGPSRSYYFDESDGNSLAVKGKKGQYAFELYEYGGPQGDWSFHGTKAPVTYTADATVPVSVPLHSLSLDVEYADGSPAPATVYLYCTDAHPSGWAGTQTYASRDVNGPSTFLMTNHVAGDDPCQLSVDPVDGDSGSAEVPGNATSFTYVVTQDPNAITLTFNLSSSSNAADRLVRVYGPAAYYDFDETAGNTFSVTGPQGDYAVRVYENGGPQGSGWSFTGETPLATYSANATVPLNVPLHTLALDVEYPGGAPAPASVQLQCPSGDPAGWVYATSSSFRDVDGGFSFLVADRGATGEDCALTVDPVSGPIGYATIPGAASSFTYVVTPGAHVTGTLSDGLGNGAPAGVNIDATNAASQPTGSAQTNASGQYDLLVASGTHILSTSTVTSSELTYRLTTNPVSVPSDQTLDLAPATDPLAVHLRTAGGTPVSSTVTLSCAGTPVGQTLIDYQTTTTVEQTGTDFVLPATAETDGTCYLDVAPTVGVHQSTPVDVPNGGDEITVVVDPGVSFTGQVSLSDPAFNGTFTNASVNVSPDGHESHQVNLAANGSFSFAGVAAGDATLAVGVNEPWGNVQFNRRVTLHEGDSFSLSPHLDYLDLYLLDITGNDGTGTAKLQCQGNQPGDVNSFTSTNVTRSGTGLIRVPGYAVTGQTCHLTVTWSDLTETQRDITLDPAADTEITLLKNGVTLTSDPFTSEDDDSVADALEAYAPHQGDGNLDGTPDYLQADVASLPENGEGLGSVEDYVTVAGPDGSHLELVATDDVVAARPSRDVGGPPDGSELPLGYLDFTVVGAPAGPTTVELTVPDTAGLNGYLSYDPGPPSTWTDMPAADVSFTPTTIVLTVTDGGPLDRDPVAGRIRHPGGGTKIDVEVPVVTGKAMTDPNNKGWYGSNVTVKWTVTDNDSAVAAPANTLVTTEGDDVTATAPQVCDRRNNCTTGKLEHLKIDKTKPVVNLSGPVNGATYVIGAVPSRQCSGTDPGGSGVPDGGACVVTVTGAAGVGTVTVTAKATDRAGNTSQKTLTYKQVYKANALSAPAAGSKMKVFKLGSTVVVRLKLLNAAGAAVTPAKAPAWVAPKASGKAKGKVNQPVSRLKPDKGTVLVKRGTFWEYRWGTAKAKSGKAYVITVKLDDGTTRTVTVGIL